jgi:lysophospholipase L1-like esterase
MRKLIPAFLALALLTVGLHEAWADSATSQLPNGGLVQTTDMIPIARCNYAGCNYRVAVGPIAPLGIGAGLASSGGNLVLSPAAPSALGGILALSAATPHEYLTYIDTSGIQHYAQPSLSDISGLAPVATSGSASDLSTGTLAAARMPALTGDISTSTGSTATTLAAVNASPGTYGSASQTAQCVINGKGLATSCSNVTITPSAIGAPTTTGTGATGTWSIGITGTAATVTTNANLTGDVTSTGNATAIAAATVTGKQLTGFASTTGSVTASDSILSAVEKLWGNAQALTINLASQVLGILPIANGGSNASTVGGAQANFGIMGPMYINGDGDSITQRHSTYFPTGNGVTSGVIVPAWQASHVYGAYSYVQNNSLVYLTVSGGTSAGSGGPTGNSGSITDNTVNWSYQPWQSIKGSDYLTWVEMFSGGSLVWDQTDGYAGVIGGGVKLDVGNQGANYSNSDTMTCTNGLAVTPVFSSGHLISGTITSPGGGSVGQTCTINTSTGSGATYTVVSSAGGTFGVPSSLTSDAVIRLPDVVASRADIIVVHDGTNDIPSNIPYSTIIANLQTIYETLRSAGKRVVVVPILPRGTGLTQTQALTAFRVNKWIRAYAKKEVWANPNNINVILADPTPYFTDGTITTSVNNAVGGSGGTAAALTEDGLHPNSAGMMIMGYVIWNAIKNAYSTGIPDYPSAGYTSLDGYDYVNGTNPAGNLLEGTLWVASNSYALGSVVDNGGKSYYCTQAGTSASSGGPTGTSTGITDGTAKWNYRWPAYMSVFASGTAGTNTAETGIVYSGSLASGYQLLRNNGSAAGTITEAIESPWSSGQAGQRQTLQFSLGSGTSNEQWILITPNVTPAWYGINSADLGTAKYFIEAEVEVSGAANLTSIYTQIVGSYFIETAGPNSPGAGQHLLPSSGAPVAWPNNGKIRLKTTPIAIPSTETALISKLWFNFDASGSAGSATVTVKINKWGIYRYLGS